MNESPSLTLAGGRVVTPDGVLDDGWVRVSGSTIEDVGTGAVAGAMDLGGRWLVPGFVDIHCHGGGGGSFTGTEVDQALAAIDTHRAHGTTTMLASLVSAPLADLGKQIGALGELVTDGRIAGIHLEGPFLSSARCGAHDPAILRPPETHAVQQLLDAGQGTIRMITLAPELDNSVNAVRLLVDNGVIAAVGHTDAVLEQVVPAVDAGATVATHLFNGMRPLHHREPGPIGALLDDERVTVELICDLVHLHPGVVKLAAGHAGAGRTVLITDAISATAAGDGVYELGKLPVTVTDGEPRLADGSLAGSTLTMDVAFRNLVACGLPVTAAVAAASARPAALLGMSDRVGAIRPGLAADLVVLDDDLGLHRVMKDGRWVDA
ncbi:N-acetylglucosamine-6-phosphate deacetylase [Saccharopolyspora erythraea]|uniref:N-acetylglucosamine-6-phosphate deacetylase n=1 Tax=Saccharopolyspora erythraea TaxID=1836 RepID=UPI001BACE000|nr:N-acetylglucosamine-6-phosphate deacetylase [Saccharopolyspora erythraea]QUH05497.1 N-acetylglucosamine-6-phosphate deacetylase [Saccharopolyspora erythraea]